MRSRVGKENANSLAIGTLAARGKGDAVKNTMKKLERA